MAHSPCFSFVGMQTFLLEGMLWYTCIHCFVRAGYLSGFSRAQLHTFSVSAWLLQVSSRFSNERSTFLSVNSHLMSSINTTIVSCLSVYDFVFVCRIRFRSIPVNRLQQIIEVLESDIVVRLVSFFCKSNWFNLKENYCLKQSYWCTRVWALNLDIEHKLTIFSLHQSYYSQWKLFCSP